MTNNFEELRNLNVISGAVSGNTEETAPVAPNSRSRKWIFVLNNYLPTDISQLSHVFNEKKWLFVFGKEIGEEGTPHLQGYIEHKHQISFKTLKNICSRWHLEYAKGSTKQNFEYASKDGDYFTNIYHEQPSIISDLRPWQKSLKKTLTEIPNDRDIIWIFDEKGNKGKTAFCKYLFHHNLAYLCKSGKASDIKHMLITTKNCRDIVIDLSRSNENFVSYTLMEELKDGFIFSTKYEGGTALISTPHIIVFANFLPDTDKLSKDRWKIYSIDEESMELYTVDLDELY